MFFWLRIALYGAALAAAWFWWASFKDDLREEGRAERNAYWQERWDNRIRAEREAFEAEQARLSGLFAAAQAEAAKKAEELAVAQRALRLEREAAIQKLRDARSAYVTSFAVAQCHLTAGFVMRHDRAAAAANGDPGPAAAPAPSSRDADAPTASGIDRASDVGVENLAALGACRQQVEAWLKFWPAVEEWDRRVRAALKQQPQAKGEAK